MPFQVTACSGSPPLPPGHHWLDRRASHARRKPFPADVEQTSVLPQERQWSGGVNAKKSVMPPARIIYIAWCRLPRPFGGKFRGMDAHAVAFSDSATVIRVTCLLDYVISGHSCCSRIGSSRSGEATTHGYSRTAGRRAAAVRLRREGSKAGRIVRAVSVEGACADQASTPSRTSSSISSSGMPRSWPKT